MIFSGHYCLAVGFISFLFNSLCKSKSHKNRQGYISLNTKYHVIIFCIKKQTVNYTPSHSHCHNAKNVIIRGLFDCESSTAA